MRTVKTTWKRADPRRCAVVRPGPQPRRAGRDTARCEWWAAAQDAFLHKDSEDARVGRSPDASELSNRFETSFCLRVSEKFSLGTGSVNHGDLKLGFADRHRWLVGGADKPCPYRKGTRWVFSSSCLGPAAHVVLNLPLLLLEAPGSSGCCLYRGKLNSAISGSLRKAGTAPRLAHCQTGPGCLTSVCLVVFLAGGGVVRRVQASPSENPFHGKEDVRMNQCL